MKKRVALYTISILTLVGLWYVFLYSPRQTEVKKLQEQINQTERQLADFTNTIEQLPVYLRTSQDLETFRLDLYSSLYARNDIMHLLKQIDTDAETNNLKVTEISPPVPELLQLSRNAGRDDSPQFLNITVRMTGQYTDFGKYVSKLEASPYFQSIGRCNIIGNRDIGPTVNCSVTFKALIGSLQDTV